MSVLKELGFKEILPDDFSRWFEAPSGPSLTKAFEAAAIDPEARRTHFGYDFGREVIPEGEITAFYCTVEKAKKVAGQKNVSVVLSNRQMR